jgi:hypothetical protein
MGHPKNRTLAIIWRQSLDCNTTPRHNDQSTSLRNGKMGWCTVLISSKLTKSDITGKGGYHNQLLCLNPARTALVHRLHKAGFWKKTYFHLFMIGLLITNEILLFCVIFIAVNAPIIVAVGCLVTKEILMFYIFTHNFDPNPSRYVK